MKVVFYTSSTSGSGRLVRGISIGNAISRRNLSWDYTIISYTEHFGHLADIFGYKHIEIPVEHENQLTKNTYQNSLVYKIITSLNPDLLIVDLLWFPIHHFIRQLSCRKIFLCHYVSESFFHIDLQNEILYFNYDDYDRLVAIEPFKTRLPFDVINPIIIRNHDELFSREDALNKLLIEKKGMNCLIAINANPGDFERAIVQYSHLESEGYRMVYSSNYQGGLFPAVDYYNAFDMIVCNASYNQYWEVKFLNKKAIIVPVQGKFTSGVERLKFGKNYKFSVNGADELVDIISQL